MKGIELIPIGPVSEEAKARLKKRSERDKARLDQMVKDAKEGKYDHIINK
jgi:hypothetical protein